MKHIWQINFVRRMLLVLTLALSAVELLGWDEIPGGMADPWYGDEIPGGMADTWYGDEIPGGFWTGKVDVEGRTKSDFGADLYAYLCDVPVAYCSKKTPDGDYYVLKVALGIRSQLCRQIVFRALDLRSGEFIT